MLRQEERLPKRLTAGARARKLPSGSSAGQHPSEGQRATLDSATGLAAASVSSSQLAPTWQPSCEGRPAGGPGFRRAALR